MIEKTTGRIFAANQLSHGEGGKGPAHVVFGQSYPFWSWCHKIASVLFLGAVVYHFFNNSKWIKGVLWRRRMGNHKQVLTLTAIFIIAAVIGLIAWGVDCGLSPALHHLLVEVHDKLTLLLFVFPVMHVWKRRQRIELFNLKR